MNSFDYIWQLLAGHGSTSTNRLECARLWDTFTTDQQRQLYRTISAKIKAGKFVNYDPVKALQENMRHLEKQQLTFDEYYTRFGTTLEQDGWKQSNPTGHQVIYVRESVQQPDHHGTIIQ